MTLCEHGCGTELRDGSKDFGEWLEANSKPGWTEVHTPERCQAATRALLDEARRELTETREKRERELHVALELLRRGEAAEKRAVEAERRLDQAMGAFQVGADEHRANTRAERFRAALEFYTGGPASGGYVWPTGEVTVDAGRRARAALAADPAPEADKKTITSERENT